MKHLYTFLNALILLLCIISATSAQQTLNPANYITVDNSPNSPTTATGAPGTTTISPEYNEVGPWYTGASTNGWGGGYRQTSQLGGEIIAGRSASWTVTVPSGKSGYYIVYNYVLQAINNASNVYYTIKNELSSVVQDSVRHDLRRSSISQTNVAVGAWVPLMIDSLNAGNYKITVGADALTGFGIMRADAIRILRSSTIGPDLEFGRRSRDGFDTARIGENWLDSQLGTTIYKEIPLFNLGTSNLTITNVSVTTTNPSKWGIKLPPNTSLPFIIPPGQKKIMEVGFNPNDEELVNDVLVITSDDPLEPTTTIPITGNGINYNFILNSSIIDEPHYNAPFDQIGNPKRPQIIRTGVWSASQTGISSFPYPVPGGNLQGTFSFDAVASTEYRFQLPDSINAQPGSSGFYYIEYGIIAFTSNSENNAQVTIIPAGSSDTIRSSFNQSGLSAPPSFISLHSQPIFINQGGFTSVNIYRTVATQSVLRADLLRIRKYTNPAPEVNPLSMNFQDIEVDSSKTLSFTIINNSGITLLIDSIYSFTRYFNANKTKDTVYSGTQKSINVTFIPGSIQNYADTLFIKNNSQIRIMKIPLSGNSPKPGPPIITSLIAGNKSNTIQWQSITNVNVRSVYIYRDTTSPAVTLYDSIQRSAISYKDSNVANGKKYYYRLKVIHRTNVESDYSNEVNAQPFNTKPHAIALNNINQLSSGKVLKSAIQFSSVGSTDTDGTIDSIFWFLDEQLISTEPSIIYNFPQGSNKVTLVVKDNDGKTDSSFAWVNRSMFVTALNGPIYAGLSILGDSAMYAVASSGAIYKMDTEGNIFYSLSVNGEIRSSSSISYDTIIYIGSSDKNLYAFSKDGNSVWLGAIPMGGEISATPVIDSASNRLYIGVSNNSFKAVNRTNGSVAWSYFADAPIKNSAVITQDRKLIFATEKGTLYGFDLNTSSTTPKWQMSFSDSLSSSLAVDNEGFVYAGTRSGRLLKILIPTGQQPSIVWQVQTGSAIIGSPVIDANGILYVGSTDTKLYSIDIQTGSIKWVFATKGAIQSTPAISNAGIIYVANDSGEVFALDSGKIVQWYYKTDSPIVAPLLYYKSTLYFGTLNKQAIAVYDSADVSIAQTSIFSQSKFQSQSSVNGIPVWGTFQGNNQRTGIFSSTGTTSVQDFKNKFPATFVLSQNYPNPFNPSTTIRYGLPVISRVSLKIYNILGQQVANLVNTEQSAGWYEKTWNADVSSGLYFYRIEVVNISDPNKRFTQLKKMILLK